MDSNNSIFQKLYAVCKEFRERLINVFANIKICLSIFLMAIVTISVSGHMTT